jgi:hypothetical protein
VADQASLQADQQPYRDPAQAVALLEAFDKQLGLSAEMTVEKRGLMVESSHAFFRAAPALFFHDLHGIYKKRSQLLPDPAPSVAIVGDAHILNAGTFRGPDGTAVWGLNDFDQADLGSPEWDLERMGVSLYVAARSGGLSGQESLDLVRAMGRSYLDSLGEKGPAFLTLHQASGKVRDLLEKVGSKSQSKLLARWTTPDGSRLLRGKDLEDPDRERGAEVMDALRHSFPDLSIADLAAKPHSGGSTRGLERYYALIDSEHGQDWILEVKAVLPSPVQLQDGDLSRGDGEKILAYARQMGSPVDGRQHAFKLGPVAFFTREREREKDSLKDKAKNLADLAPQLGKVLARAHNSSGADLKAWVDGRDEQLLDNLASFSKTYARQVESDYRALAAKYPPATEPPDHGKKKKKNSAGPPDSFDGFQLAP